MTTETALPPWSRTTVYVLGGVVGGCALAASGFELYSLARNAGFSWPVSAVLPIGLDAGAAGSAVLWVVGAPGSTRRRDGRVTTLVLVGASAVCNGLSVLAEPERAVLSAWVVTAVAVLIGVLFPLVAARMIHLVLTVRDDAAGGVEPATKPAEPQAATEVEPGAPAPDPAPEPDVDTGPATEPLPVSTGGTEDDETLLAILRAMPVATSGPNAGVLPARGKARPALGKGWDETDRLLEVLRTERTETVAA